VAFAVGPNTDHWPERCVQQVDHMGAQVEQRAVLEALANDLDVPGALDLAITAGGQAARDLIAVLAL